MHLMIFAAATGRKELAFILGRLNQAEIGKDVL
jgi:hypothetical protein